MMVQEFHHHFCPWVHLQPYTANSKESWENSICLGEVGGNRAPPTRYLGRWGNTCVGCVFWVMKKKTALVVVQLLGRKTANRSYM